eukprot:g15444.t1
MRVLQSVGSCLIIVFCLLRFGTGEFSGLSLQLEVWVEEACLSVIGQSDHVGVLRRVESRSLAQFLVTYCLGFVVSVEMDESLGLSHFRFARIWAYPCHLRLAEVDFDMLLVCGGVFRVEAVLVSMCRVRPLLASVCVITGCWYLLYQYK